MNKEYVLQYAELEKEHWWFLVRQRIIQKFLKKYLPPNNNEQLHILNIGVSGGATSKLLSAFGTVVSVETDPLFIEYLKTRNIEVTEASITSLPFKDYSFDLVCAFDVMEHVEDDGSAMKEMTRVCKEEGAICVTVPAFNMLWSNHDIVNDHYRRYTRKSLDGLFLSSSKLQKIKTLYFNSLLFLPIWIARKISNLSSKNKKETESDFSRFKTSGVLNRILRFIFGLEVPMLGIIHFPFGVSLISLLQKKDSPSTAVKK